MMGHRQTMGQDWGGRTKLNPENCPRVTGRQVEELADTHGIQVKREAQGMWFVFKQGQWYTLGQTNYLALKQLQWMIEIPK